MGKTTYQELREVWGINIGPLGTPEAFARNGVLEHPYAYAENNPLNRVDPSGEISGPCYGERKKGYCGRASQEMVIDFWKPSFHSKWDQNKVLSCSYIAQYTGKAYTLESGAPTEATIDSIIKSLDAGNPVIVYTSAYGQHIFVLVSYDPKKCLFHANNPLPPGKKGVERCQAGVTKVGGTELTRKGLLDLLKGGSKVYGHVACYVK